MGRARAAICFCISIYIISKSCRAILRKPCATTSRTRHIQFAGVPGRHEPDVGEINYPFLFDLIDELDYRGWVGCEYRPLGHTEAGLGWAVRYGIAAASAR